MSHAQIQNHMEGVWCAKSSLLSIERFGKFALLSFDHADDRVVIQPYCREDVFWKDGRAATIFIMVHHWAKCIDPWIRSLVVVGGYIDVNEVLHNH